MVEGMEELSVVELLKLMPSAIDKAVQQKTALGPLRVSLITLVNITIKGYERILASHKRVNSRGEDFNQAFQDYKNLVKRLRQCPEQRRAHGKDGDSDLNKDDEMETSIDISNNSNDNENPTQLKGLSEDDSKF